MNGHDITIGFSTTKNYLSRLIRRVTASPCSHAFIVFTDSSLKMRMVMQAEAWGFEVRPLKRWIENNILVAEFKPVTTGGRLEKPLYKIAGYLGVKYDYENAFFSGLKSLLERWHKSRFTLKLARSPHKLMCSEAVTRFLAYAKFEAVKGLDPESTSPGELLKILLNSPREFKRIYLNEKYIKYDREIKAAILSGLIIKKDVFDFDKSKYAGRPKI